MTFLLGSVASDPSTQSVHDEEDEEIASPSLLRIKKPPTKIANKNMLEMIALGNTLLSEV